MTDPIVIVGMSVETPGDVTTLDQLWSTFQSTTDVLGPLPTDRGWDLDQLASVGMREGWSSVAPRGGFLSGAAEFDAEFFGVSPREATAMDPQQRVSLRVAWRAIENAGINPTSLKGTRTGCFLGALANGYGPPMSTISEHSGYLLTGTSLSAISGRVAHHLGLRGPTMTIDSGCAASLTAIHQATNALRLGECDFALAGGTTVMGSEMMFVEFARNGALSTDGRCRPYSANTTGSVWSEGSAILVLTRESVAAAAGCRVIATVAAVRSNHNGNGTSHAMAVPSESAQRALITETIAAAQISAQEVAMIDGHGTGTRVGDPIELAALAATYGRARKTHGQPPVALGSAKSHLGHTQAAAGALSVVKVILSAQRGQIAPTLNDGTPHAIFGDPVNGLTLAATAPWPESGAGRFGAISAFGIGGTNTHLIVGIDTKSSGAQ